MMLLLLMLTNCFAFAGQERGGGSVAGLEFTALAKVAITDARDFGVITANEADDLTTVLNRAKIIVSPEALVVTLENGKQQRCVATNDPALQKIDLDELKWKNLIDDRVKNAIALHELESLAGRESTRHYGISAELLDRLGYVGDKPSAIETGSPALVSNYQVEPLSGFFMSCTRNALYLDHQAAGSGTPKSFDLNFLAEGMRWRDSSKAFTISIHDPKAQGKSSPRNLIQKASTEALATDFLDHLKVKRANENFIETAAGVDIQKSESVADEYFLADGSVRSDPSDGSTASSPPDVFTYLPDGSEIQTTTAMGNGSILDNWEMIKTTTVCKFSNRKIEERKIIPASLEAKLDSFTKIHQSSLLARNEWLRCQASPQNSDCSEQKTAYLNSDSIRSKAWDDLISISDAAALLPPRAPSPSSPKRRSPKSPRRPTPHPSREGGSSGIGERAHPLPIGGGRGGVCIPLGGGLVKCL